MALSEGQEDSARAICKAERLRSHSSWGVTGIRDWMRPGPRAFSAGRQGNAKKTEKQEAENT